MTGFMKLFKKKSSSTGEGDLVALGKLEECTGLESTTEYLDAQEFQRSEELDEHIRQCADQACVKLKSTALEQSEEWTVWSDKKKLAVQVKKTSESNTICGRGTYTWSDAPTGLNMEFVETVMWDENAKKKYDENTDSMVCFFTVDDDTNLTCQAFKGRFGFAGRYFHVVIHRRRETEGDTDRLILGARSLDENWLELAHQHVDRDEARIKLDQIESKQVQGFAYVAGIVIEHERKENVFRITYVNDADIVTVGIPKWIIDRVKLDQLSVVKNIPNVILEAWNNREQS
ncbi:hypothetical protein GNI_016620 [Gregarina niphandrodes]|uniref:START domain protein n=1 Tax=Gregarina niphandrodes TaxID=110365 RepID=A0A023BCB1_GRENI|nr:hypothetical protein GNI_016620 [Gregarina niphandrodes]EZG82437.1 hypothetical protein GNI_016620 [Gregarina niphandrodes]|eukprot:XP_011129006.1 hypothetical protein GNI_016620 [Gregarina niphandrodes]